MGELFIDGDDLFLVGEYALSIIEIIIEDSDLEDLPEDMQKSALSSAVGSDEDIHVIIFPIVESDAFMG